MCICICSYFGAQEFSLKNENFTQKACPFNDLLVDCLGRFLTATKVLKYITHNAIQKYSLAAGME